MSRIRNLLLILALAVALPTAVVACGGGDDNGGSSSADPQDVLNKTFNNDNAISSGVLDLTASVSAGDQGNFDFELQGPFQGDANKPTLPQLDWTASASGQAAGQSLDFQGELVVTDDNAYIVYGGNTYEVGSDTFSQFKQLIEQSAQQAGGTQTGTESFKESCSAAVEQAGGDTSVCDVDFTSWFTNLSNQGTEDVDGVSTTHISGDLDVGKIVNDFVAIAEQAGGASAVQLDTSQLDQVEKAIKSAHFDVYSGADDQLLRKVDMNLSIDPSAIPGATPVPVDSVDLNFAVTLSDVNADQTISAPSGPTKPLDQLLSGLGALGLGLPSTGGGTGGTSDSTDKYLECVSQATSAAEIQKCEALL